ncbi:MAG TPA: cupin domain-containing protein [Alphaproteobacteria bacterium]|nr:cupin domain-containing protein [Alphaproteobacteria bacterium]
MIEVLDLAALGQGLPVDTDHAITAKAAGPVLIIRLAPGEYPTESHKGRIETITALTGRFSIEAAGGRWDVAQGQCCRIPPGLEHRWGADSEAVVLVHFAEAE